MEIDSPTVYALGHTHIDVAWKRLPNKRKRL